MSKRTLLLLGLIVISSLLVDFFKLTRDNGWGDDFAAYIMQAQSIAEGTMHEFVQHNTFTMEQSSWAFGPITEPWGFPLMLAPVYALFGLKILALKAVVTLCFTLFLPTFFLLSRKILNDSESLLLTAAVAFNPVLLGGQSEVLSDIPGTLFSTLSLLLISSWAVNPGQRGTDALRGVLIGLAMFMTVFIRWSGLTIFVPLVTTQLLSYVQGTGPRTFRYNAAWAAAVPYATFGLLYGLQNRLFPSVYSLDAYPFASISVQSVWANVQEYFWMPADFFANPIVGASIPYFGLLIFFLLSLTRWRIRDLPIHAYILATMGLLVLYPSTGGPRVLYPLFPLFLLFAFDGMKRAIGWLKHDHQKMVLTFAYALWTVMAVVSFAASASSAWKNMAANRNTPGRYTGAFGPGSTAMFDFVKHHTPVDSVVIFQQPRAMRLRTDRDSFLTTRCSDLVKADYVVAVMDGGAYSQIPPDEVQTCNPSVTLLPVYNEDMFIVYQILPTS